MNEHETSAGFPAPRRGRRKGQAVKQPAGMRPLDYMLLSLFGSDWAENRSLLDDCKLACDYSYEGQPPKALPKKLNALAWRMLQALKCGDAKWFQRLLAVRNGAAFQKFSTRGKRTYPIDGDGFSLAQLVQLQSDGRKGPQSDQEIADYVAARRDVHDDTPVPTTKTLGKRFLAMGGVKNRKRGRKSMRL